MRLLPGADVLTFVDIDSSQRRVYGHKKQGAAFGPTKIQGKTVLGHVLSKVVQEALRAESGRTLWV